MKGVDNLWTTLWITRGFPVDNSVDNLWRTPHPSAPVDNPMSYSQVIHRGRRFIHSAYPQADWPPGRGFPPIIHISTGPTTTTTKSLRSFKKDSSNRREKEGEHENPSG